MIPADYHQYIVLGTLILVLTLLFKEFIRASLAFFLGVIILLLSGIIQPINFLTDLANPQIATIILLIILTSALRKNYHTEKYLDKIFAGVKTTRGFMLRLMVFVSSMSAFVNNTPLVAVMMPYVYDWSKKHGAYSSKIFIPLSYAAIMGGMMTVIGTSTNLILNGFLTKNNLPTLETLDFFVVGFAITVFGILYLYFVGYHWLPENKEVFNEAKAKAPEYLLEVKVGSPKLAGTTVAHSGIDKVSGIYLIELHRQNEIISPVAPQETLQLNDSLLFMGQSAKIMDLVNSGMGFSLPIPADHKSEVVEAVIPTGSSLIGKNLEESRFDKAFHAELLALHRNGQKLTNRLNTIRFAQGDMLLLSVHEEFGEQIENNYDLYVLSRLNAENSNGISVKAKLFLGIFGLLFGLIVFDFMTILAGLLVMLFFLFVFDLFNYKDLAEKVDTDLILMLASALTIGNALVETGAAKMIADVVINFSAVFGNSGILIGLYLLTLVLTAFLSNAAAVSIAFPIAFSLSQQLGLDGKAFYMAIVFAASGDFMTPIGYQTNLMVYNAGGYRPRDFLKVGFPMTIIYSLVAILMILWRYEL